MRIVQLISGETWSGGQQQCLHLTSGLAERGHEVILVCQEGSELQARARASGHNVITHPMRSVLDVSLMMKLHRLAAGWGAEVMDVHRAKAHGAAMVVRSLHHRMALVASRRVSFVIPSRISARVKFDLLLDGIIAVSGNVRESLEKRGIPPKKIRVIYGGVDTGRFRPGTDGAGIREEFSLSDGVRVMVIVANYMPWKGQAWFLGLLPEIIRGAGPVRVILAGRGTDSAEVRKLAESLGVDDSVTGAGFRDDVDRILAAADLLVCPSLEGEGMTGAVREAMAAGVPVVSTAAGGNPEIVMPGRTGYLVPPGDGPSMVSACIEALCSGEKSKKMAREARRLVLDQYSVFAMVEKTEKYYRELVDRKKERRVTS